mgnify:FL=1|jgi:holo-[acyl-carrier protein] synthase
MRLFNIGVDIVDTRRFKNNISNKNFLERVFSNSEIKHCQKKKLKLNCYAKRFAAKEAFAKALGTGIRSGINFNDIYVSNNLKGAPSLNIKGQTLIKLKKKLKNKKFKLLLSLADEKYCAIAMVAILI